MWKILLDPDFQQLPPNTCTSVYRHSELPCA